MRQKIVGYNKDEAGDWRAELACGHLQHVRHQPPLVSRQWVLNEDGRQQKIGAELDCRKCDESAPADIN